LSGSAGGLAENGEKKRSEAAPCGLPAALCAKKEPPTLRVSGAALETAVKKSGGEPAPSPTPARGVSWTRTKPGREAGERLREAD